MPLTPDDEHDDLLAAAGEVPEEGSPEDTPRCPSCGSALDDVAKMTDKEVLVHMRTEFYRDLFRDLKRGMATHQEKAIVRGVLRDNKMIAEDDPGDDDDVRPRGRKSSKSPLMGDDYTFSPDTLDETEGG